MHHRLLLIAISAAALASCTTGKRATTPEAVANPMLGGYSGANTPVHGPSRHGPALTYEEALIRSRQIAQISYNLWFGLNDADEDFDGRAVVTFVLRNTANLKIPLPKTLFLDFDEGTIRSMKVNDTAVITPGETVSSERYDGHRIHLKLNELQPTGINRIEISFSHNYSRNGQGLFRYKDPTDGQVYLYTHLEPNFASRVFPCFDQPDLKASFELTVETPDGWQVISNTTERDVSNVDGRKSWAFPPSPLLSTYVFALHAGPYASWKADADGIPLRLFSRQSLKAHVDNKELFDITKKGLEFFNLQFGYPYPYSKYDQVLVPDFNNSGMENAAAATLSERFIFRTPVTQDTRRERAETLLHELAHMWFGNLVTMKWWNGLWLNESFATFMAAWAVDETTPFRGAWPEFYGLKNWAYWEDQLPTTHPIEMPIKDTDQAKAHFDGITYGKGAAVLKQLRFFVGEDDFREGIQRYFQKFALRSTTLSDFIKMISEASSKDLSKWQKTWLTTPGLNTLRAEWGCDADGKIDRFKLVQLPPEGSPELRPHRARVALYGYPKKGGLQPSFTQEVQYTDAETPVPQLIGKPCPSLVFPNQGDFDYAKVELDPVSLETVKTQLGKIDDAFARQMLWHSLWEMVLDAKLSPVTYTDIAIAFSAQEKDSQVLRRILRTLTSRAPLFPSVLRYLPENSRTATREKIENFVLTRLKTAPTGSDLQKIWWNAFLQVASQPKSVEFLNALYTAKARLEGMPLDQEQRWALLGALARHSGLEIQDRVSAELRKDPTELGARAAVKVEAAIPDGFFKKKWFAKFTNPIPAPVAKVTATPSPAETVSPEPSVSPTPAAIPASQLREAMEVFQDLDHQDLMESFVDTYFESLPRLVLTGDDGFSRNFTRSLFPALCRPEIIQKTSVTLEQHPELSPEIIKILKTLQKEEERCIQIRKKS